MNPALPIALLAGGYLLYRVVAPAAPQKREIEGPLRPPPPPPDAQPPGPAATKLQAFVDSLSDEQLQLVRSAMPERWWGFLAAAVHAPSDALFRFTLGPLKVEYDAIIDKEQFQSDVVGAIGFGKALEVQAILKEAGVI